MSEVRLGELPPVDAQRDAVHVAVIPVVAAVSLTAGQRVSLRSDGKAVPAGSEPIGIVDPYLGDAVHAGDRFWLCLLPGTVTGMRHHWSHPIFAGALPVVISAARQASELWLRQFCSDADLPKYETVLAAASGRPVENPDPDHYPAGYEYQDEYLCFYGRYAQGEIPREFWDHVENVTGVKCIRRPAHFACVC